MREAGHRMVYEPFAVAREELPERRDEWRRRVRIGAGDYQALWLCRACLRPRYGWFAWCFWSHKALRWFTPHTALILLGSSVYSLLASRPGLSEAEARVLFRPSTLALIVMSSIGTLAVSGRVLGSRFSLGLALWHFIEMQAALFVGFLRFCRGNLRGRWDRTPRTGRERETRDRRP